MNAPQGSPESRVARAPEAQSSSAMRFASTEELLARLTDKPPLDPPDEPAGEVSGRALRDWRLVVTRALGPQAVERVRAESGLDPRALPDDPSAAIWLPVGHQLRLTRAALRLSGETLAALPRLLVTPALGVVGRVRRQLLKLALPPATLLARADRIHADLYRPGQATSTPVVRNDGAREAEVRWWGAPFHADPTWRALQVAAVSGFFAAIDVPLSLADATGPEALSFALALRWT
jgi:hypothetical protein